MSRARASTISPVTHDVAEFIREAQRRALRDSAARPVRLRRVGVGRLPRVAAEGPRHRGAQPRSEIYGAARRWLLRLGKELAPLQVGNGGPIIAVQVENEYGSFGRRPRVHGADSPPSWSMPDSPRRCSTPPTDPTRFRTVRCRICPPGSTLRPGNAAQGFRHAAQAASRRPLHGQRVVGWMVRSLGRQARHHRRQGQAAELDWILAQGYSISIYMFHGGTSFGWMNGANMDNELPAGRDQLRLRCRARRERPARRRSTFLSAMPSRRLQASRRHRFRLSIRPCIALPTFKLQAVRLAVAHAAATRRTPSIRLRWKISIRPTATFSIARPRRTCLGRSGSRRTPRLRAGLCRRQAARHARSAAGAKPLCHST